jgi:signal peptidase II
MASPRSARSLVMMLVSLLLLLALDLGSKEWALDRLSEARSEPSALGVCELDAHGRSTPARIATSAVPFIDGVLQLNYAENCGAAFSMLRTAPRWLRLGIFVSLSVGASLWLITLYARGHGGPLFAAAVPLVASGAIGNNLWDRPRHGFVVDFLQVDPALFHYPVFNVADVWIAVGVGLLLLDGWRRPSEGKGPTKAPARPVGILGVH